MGKETCWEIFLDQECQRTVGIQKIPSLTKKLLIKTRTIKITKLRDDGERVNRSGLFILEEERRKGKQNGMTGKLTGIHKAALPRG